MSTIRFPTSLVIRLKRHKTSFTPPPTIHWPIAQASGVPGSGTPIDQDGFERLHEALDGLLTCLLLAGYDVNSHVYVSTTSRADLLEFVAADQAASIRPNAGATAAATLDGEFGVSWPSGASTVIVIPLVPRTGLPSPVTLLSDPDPRSDPDQGTVDVEAVKAGLPYASALVVGCKQPWTTDAGNIITALAWATTELAKDLAAAWDAANTDLTVGFLGVLLPMSWGIESSVPYLVRAPLMSVGQAVAATKLVFHDGSLEILTEGTRPPPLFGSALGGKRKQSAEALVRSVGSDPLTFGRNVAEGVGPLQRNQLKYYSYVDLILALEEEGLFHAESLLFQVQPLGARLVESIDEMDTWKQLLLWDHDADIAALEADSVVLSRLDIALEHFAVLKMGHHRGEFLLTGDQWGQLKPGVDYRLKLLKDGSDESAHGTVDLRFDGGATQFTFTVDKRPHADEIHHQIYFKTVDAQSAAVDFTWTVLETGMSPPPEPQDYPHLDTIPDDRPLLLELTENHGMAVIAADGPTSLAAFESLFAPLASNQVVMLAGDFRAQVRDHGIPSITLQNAVNMGLVNARAHVPYIDHAIAESRVWGTAPTSPSASAIRWNSFQGLIAEKAQLSRFDLDPQIDLNNPLRSDEGWVDARGRFVRHNYIGFDTSSGRVEWEQHGTPGRIFTVKGSRQVTPEGRQRTYQVAVDDMMGGMGDRRDKINRIAQQMFPLEHLPEAERLPQARRLLFEWAWGIVNPEDVLAPGGGGRPVAHQIAHNVLVDDALNAAYERAQRADWVDWALNREPVSTSAGTFGSLDALNAANLTEAQLDDVYRVLADRFNTRMMGNHHLLDGQGLRNLVSLAVAQAADDVRTELSASPSLVLGHRAGLSTALTQATVRGGTWGGGASAAIEIVSQVGEGRLSFSDVVASTAVGGGSEVLGGAADVGATMMVQRLGGSAGLGRVVGGGVGSVVAAPVFEVGIMIYDDSVNDEISYNRVDYVGRAGKSAVGGLISGAAVALVLAPLTLPAAGAIAVGFAVGAIAYGLFDIAAGQATESWFRDLALRWVPPRYQLQGPIKVEDFGYFILSEVMIPASEEVHVYPTGHYAMRHNLLQGIEELWIEVRPANGAAEIRLGGEDARQYVPHELLNPYRGG